MAAFCLSWCTLLVCVWRWMVEPLPVLLLDYHCFKPPDERRCSLEFSEYFCRRSRKFSSTSEEFMRTIFAKSGLGDETYGPPFIFQTDYEAKLKYAIEEAEDGMFAAVDGLLRKTQVLPSQIEVVVVCCSMFTPSPSLAAHIVNHFGFPPTVRTFNLSGMGCSAGTISVDLAATILRRNTGYALLVNTENTSLNWYFGDNRHMLVTNCIFRVGTNAVLLTSDPSMRDHAKMELLLSLRTHHGADDAAYGAAMQVEDDDGNVGVALKKDLVRVAGAGLRDHIRTLAPKVLPLSQLLYYAYHVVKSLLIMSSSQNRTTHVPEFTTAFEHMCIHTGGKAVIDAVGRLMKLPKEVLEPSKMSLHRFGNTSSSLVFYQLAYFEAKERIKKGDRVWMLAFGTGFKACSVVWKALRDSTSTADNPWNHCIHRYPI